MRVNSFVKYSMVFITIRTNGYFKDQVGDHRGGKFMWVDKNSFQELNLYPKNTSNQILKNF
jgi:hypothetical protein